MAKITETITFNFDDEAQQKRFHAKLRGAEPVLADLPEDIQIPLIKLKADMGYLMGRVAQDPDCAGMMADAALENLSQLETALYRALIKHVS
jgi:glyoxylate carboligase